MSRPHSTCAFGWPGCGLREAVCELLKTNMRLVKKGFRIAWEAFRNRAKENSIPE